MHSPFFVPRSPVYSFSFSNPHPHQLEPSVGRHAQRRKPATKTSTSVISDSPPDDVSSTSPSPSSDHSVSRHNAYLIGDGDASLRGPLSSAAVQSRRPKTQLPPCRPELGKLWSVSELCAALHDQLLLGNEDDVRDCLRGLLSQHAAHQSLLSPLIGTLCGLPAEEVSMSVHKRLNVIVRMLSFRV